VRDVEETLVTSIASLDRARDEWRMTNIPQTIAHLADDAERRLGTRVTAHVPSSTSTGFTPVTFAELARMKRDIAGALYARGVRRGDRVAIVSDTRLEWCAADLAILSLGAVTVGVYPSSTPDQMRFILSHAQCKGAFVAGAAPRASLQLARDALPPHAFVVDLDADLAAFRAEASDVPSLDVIGLMPDDVATIVYTSGTTGRPKGVVLTHKALFNTSRTGIAALDIGAHDEGVGFLPLAHVLARVNFYGTLHSGSTIWFAKSMEEVADVWRAAHPTVLALVPRVLEKIQGRILAAVADAPAARQKLFARALEVGTDVVARRERGEKISRSLSVEHALWERLVYKRVRAGLGWDRLRFALSGGAPLRRDVATFFAALGVVILEGYGLSETSAASVLSLPGASKIGSVGRPLPGVEVRIAPDGEILLHGPGLFTRYEGDDEDSLTATREAFDADGFFRTGDVGTLDGDGYLRITDRKKDLLVTAGGKNVAPQAIEAALLADARLAQAIVVGDGRAYLSALVALDPLVVAPDAPHAQREAIVAEAVQRANATLARFEQIKRWTIVDELTIADGLLTPTQKVRRKAVTERYASLIDAMYRAPSISEASTRS
jgi:long-chain acyl-CoA synthetase